MLWVIHMVALFWKVFFPYQAKSLQSSKRLKAVYALCVIVALVSPLIPVIATFAHFGITRDVSTEGTPGRLGFGLVRFPPLLCSGLNSEITFYTVILPTILLIMVGITTLILVIWRIHKVVIIARYD